MSEPDNAVIYARILAELERKGRDLQWLADNTGVDRSATYMWKSRKVPAAKYAAIALALGQTVEWLLGREGRKDGPALSDMAMKIAREFDQLRDEGARLEAFARCLTAIGRAAGSDGPIP
jgi:lambda repressor-like predicted transcriptional regulator